MSLSSSNPDCLTVLQLESAVRISQTHAVASAQKSVVPYWRCQWTLAAALVWPRRSCVRRATRWLFRAAVEEINLIVGYRREGSRRLIGSLPIWERSAGLRGRLMGNFPIWEEVQELSWLRDKWKGLALSAVRAQASVWSVPESLPGVECVKPLPF